MASNEQLGCGCKVYQKKIGTTIWNRIDMCSVHYSAKELLDALKAVNEWFGVAHCRPGTPDAPVAAVQDAIAHAEAVTV
jgi:hypothetical protein